MVLAGRRFAAMLLAMSLMGWAQPVFASEKRPSILLVTFDTTRADHLGAYGYELAATPTIDALASRGVLFESAVTTTPVTLPSHASILTGTYPSAHGVHDNAVFTLATDATLVSEVFQRAGWRTGAFIGSFVLDRRFGLDQGFEKYRGPADPEAFTATAARRPADEVVDDAIAWFAELAATERFFAWVHFYDPHRPLPEVDLRSRETERPYDRAISHADAQLGRLLRYLREQKLDERLVTVVTADHGEGNGEHGEKTHGIFLYQSVMRVPLIFTASDAMSWPSHPVRVERAVSNVAIAPTLLAIAGLGRSEMPDVKVRSLLTVAGDVRPNASAPGLYLESYTPYYSYHWRALRAIVDGNRKLIRGVTPELYSLDLDPDERNDRAAQLVGQVSDLSASLDELLRVHAPLGWVESQHVSDADAALLASLGYSTPTVSKSSDEDPFASTLPDPRNRIGDLALIDETAEALTRWSELSSKAGTAWQRDKLARENLEPSRKAMLRLQQNNPHDPNAPLLLGAIEDASGNSAAAVIHYERFVAIRPTDSTVQARLATVYAKVGRSDEAIERMEYAISLSPRQSRYYHWLIEHLLDSGKFDRATHWLDRFDEALEPGTALRLQVKLWIVTQRRRVPES
jgi:arylsulfatase A-like enzyme